MYVKILRKGFGVVSQLAKFRLVRAFCDILRFDFEYN